MSPLKSWPSWAARSSSWIPCTMARKRWPVINFERCPVEEQFAGVAKDPAAHENFR